jgi:LysM repeat protein
MMRDCGKILIFLGMLCLAGCRSGASASPAVPSPVYWESPTVSPTWMFPTPAVSWTPTIVPTGTPSQYTIREGDTLGSISAKTGVSVEAILEANPGLNPNALPIGKVILIPAPATKTPESQPSPTPVALQIGPGRCFLQTGGGKWCLALIANPGSNPVTSVMARFSLYADVTAAPSASHEVALPLSVLPAGMRMVAAAFFPPEEAAETILRVELTAAIQTPSAPEILPVEILSQTSASLTDGLEVGADFQIDPKASSPAKYVDAVLILLDSSGEPIGFRVEKIEGDFPPGKIRHLTLCAYILGGQLDSFQLVIQARSK